MKTSDNMQLERVRAEWETVVDHMVAYLKILPSCLDARTEFSDRVITETIVSVTDSLASRVKLLTKCESPVECIFALALNDLLPRRCAEGAIQSEFILANQSNDILHTPWSELQEKYQTPAFTAPTVWNNQVDVNCGGTLYRVDFLFVTRLDGEELLLAVELDGHDFHEKTKEQAERDKKRDRDMLARGIRVIRFTGSEVWRDPAKCAVEALAMVNAMAITSAHRTKRAQNEASAQEA